MTNPVPGGAGPRLLVWVGDGPPPAAEGLRVVHVAPRSTTPTGVVDSVRVTGVQPSDLKVQALVGFDPDADVAVATAVYATLCVLSGRRLDVSCADRILNLAQLDKALRALPSSARPASPPACVQVGGTHPDLPSVVIGDGQLSAADVDLVRHARRVRLVATGSLPEVLSAFVAVAALRARPGTERFPLLVAGDEPADPDPLPADRLPAGLDLDTIRAGALDLRRAQRGEREFPLAPVEPATERRRRLAAVGCVDMVATMKALGAISPDGELWHCPRPERHANGDANASMRVEGSRARCYRCDPEWVNPVRLVADVHGWSFDAAADWLALQELPPAPPADPAATPGRVADSAS
jgi:hypothetical protein